MPENGNHRGGLFWASVHRCKGRDFMDESQKQDFSTSGLPVSLQTEAASEVLCWAASNPARANQVKLLLSEYKLQYFIIVLRVCANLCKTVFFHFWKNRIPLWLQNLWGFTFLLSLENSRHVDNSSVFLVIFLMSSNRKQLLKVTA